MAFDRIFLSILFLAPAIITIIRPIRWRINRKVPCFKFSLVKLFANLWPTSEEGWIHEKDDPDIFQSSLLWGTLESIFIGLILGSIGLICFFAN